MDRKVSETIIEVFEVLLPKQEVMDTFPPEAQARLYNLAFFISGLLAGSRISALQVQTLVEKIVPGTKVIKSSASPKKPEETKKEKKQTKPGKFSA